MYSSCVSRAPETAASWFSRRFCLSVPLFTSRLGSDVSVSAQTLFSGGLPYVGVVAGKGGEDSGEKSEVFSGKVDGRKGQ